jgi:(R,R)-butanediol dehydrogenase / meso-butanediol dehydrogenase / diacetyl reductase
MMKAAVWHGRQDVRVQDVSDPPPPPPGQVQVEVAWCGICGTDLHEYLEGPIYIPVDAPHPLTGIRAPVITGHEMSGRVVAVGESVEDFAVGDRIVACPIIGCLECRWCKSGSMAQCNKVAFMGTSWTGGALSERLNLYAYQCYHLPDALTDEVAAMVEPFASTARAIVNAGVKPEDSVAIVGPGPIGLMSLMAALIFGSRQVVVVGKSDRRLEIAKQCGATSTIDLRRDNPLERTRELTNEDGFDVVVECGGQRDSALLAGRLTRTRGRLVVMGVFDKPAPLDLTDLVFREKKVMGSMSGYGYFDQSIAMMMDPRFRGESLITRRIRLDELVEGGLRALLSEKGKHVKIIASPH